MDLYTRPRTRRGALRSPTSSGRTAASRGGIIPESIRGTVRQKRMFQRITEAYETLVDPARREQYDAGGHGRRAGSREPSFEFTEFDFSVAAQGAQAATFTELFAEVLHPIGLRSTPGAGSRSGSARGADHHLLDAMRGVERQVVVTRQESCAACRGAGTRVDAGGAVRAVPRHRQVSAGRAATWCSRKPARRALGTGRQRQQRCGLCGAHGRVVRTEGVSVSVPPGPADGTRLRVPEKGHAGRDGGRTGDLYVIVQVQPHPLFRREGDDLHLELPVAVHEAVLGARIEVPSLDGPFKLTIPPGTQGGRRFRVSGRGVADAGRRPRRPGGPRAAGAAAEWCDERSRELMREFGRRNNDDVRKALRSTSAATKRMAKRAAARRTT